MAEVYVGYADPVRQKAHQKSWAVIKRASRRRWHNGVKSMLVCEHCGENHHACLDFHHTNPHEKTMNVGRLVNGCRPLLVIVGEMEKCQVLCANCRRKEHYAGV